MATQISPDKHECTEDFLRRVERALEACSGKTWKWAHDRQVLYAQPQNDSGAFPIMSARMLATNADRDWIATSRGDAAQLVSRLREARAQIHKQAARLEEADALSAKERRLHLGTIGRKDAELHELREMNTKLRGLEQAAPANSSLVKAGLDVLDLFDGVILMGLRYQDVPHFVRPVERLRSALRRALEGLEPDERTEHAPETK